MAALPPPKPPPQTGFFLVDNRPYRPSAGGNPQRWHWKRRKPVQLVVLHTAQNRTDLVGVDSGLSLWLNILLRGGAM